jgi:hypothetical protein
MIGSTLSMMQAGPGRTSSCRFSIMHWIDSIWTFFLFLVLRACTRFLSRLQKGHRKDTTLLDQADIILLLTYVHDDLNSRTEHIGRFPAFTQLNDSRSRN